MKAVCAELGLPAGVTYDSTKYPVKVPVTYFQGGLDGATVAPSGIQHWKKVPQGKKQLVIAPEGGHNPTGGFKMDSQIRIFTTAIKGEKITKEMLDEANADDRLKLVYTSVRY